MAVEWSPDFCLTCDRQCPAGAAYCSPSCKLADAFEFESSSNSSSPLSIASSAPHAPQNTFYLPPSLQYSSSSPYSKHSGSSTSPLPSRNSSTSTTSSRNPSITQQHHHHHQQQQSNGLQPSASRTSLSSLPSQYGSHESSYLSNKAAKELRAYENAFDQVRGWKRRMTITG